MNEWHNIKATTTAQKMKFSIKDFFSKYDQIRRVTFTEEILNGKLHFLCSVLSSMKQILCIFLRNRNGFKIKKKQEPKTLNSMRRNVPSIEYER